MTKDDDAGRDDPGGQPVLLLQDRLAGATGRLLATAASLTDRQVAEPSPLPGWSRGHVLTHLARNADGLRNLLIWARTGVVTPQYPSGQARDAAIEAGAGRPAAGLLADLRDSAAAFAAEAAGMPPGSWQVSVHGIRGRGHPAWYTLWRRLSEVEIHHVDLAAGYQPADWPSWFVTGQLESVSAQFDEQEDALAAVLSVTGAGAGPEYRIGTGPAADGTRPPAVRISGPGWLLLAWLTGRSDGTGLAADPPGPLPARPAW
jgi:maleylpyruvate isomerase